MREEEKEKVGEEAIESRSRVDHEAIKTTHDL